MLLKDYDNQKKNKEALNHVIINCFWVGWVRVICRTFGSISTLGKYENLCIWIGEAGSLAKIEFAKCSSVLASNQFSLHSSHLSLGSAQQEI